MPTQTVAAFRITGGYAADGDAVSAYARTGSVNMPSGIVTITPAGADVLAGTVVGLTIPASGNHDINLTSITDILGRTVAFTKIHHVYLRLAAGTSGHVRLGPQGVTDAAGLWFSGTGSAAYVNVQDAFFITHPGSGWAVSGTEKIVRVHNPTASTISGRIMILGSIT